MARIMGTLRRDATPDTEHLEQSGFVVVSSEKQIWIDDIDLASVKNSVIAAREALATHPWFDPPSKVQVDLGKVKFDDFIKTFVKTCRHIEWRPTSDHIGSRPAGSFNTTPPVHTLSPLFSPTGVFYLSASV